MPLDEPLVRAHDLQVGYADYPVCPPVSLTVTPGQAVAVIGANGTGKSTFLRTALGLQPAIDGTAELLGARPDPRTGETRAAVASVRNALAGDDEDVVHAGPSGVPRKCA